MPLKIYQVLLKVGALAALLCFFVIANKMYFPFITGKQLYFNIVVEMMLALWLPMIIKYPATRPKQSWITWGLAAFLLALLVSAFTGVDFNLSFWGDSERMLGWFSLVHFFGYYLVLISVFRERRDWAWLINSLIVSAVALVAYAFATYDGTKASGNVNMTSNISTLGNATYVAGVMLFAFWLSVYQLIRVRDWTAKFLYVLAALFILAGFFYADVSGSQAGWGLSVLVFLAFYGWLDKRPKLRRNLRWGLTAFVVVVALMFAFRQAPIFDHNKVGKILRDFSWKNTNLNTRTYAWRAGLKGFVERPLLGSGYGNYAYWFDKFFVGDYYRWTTGEEYFDRAHNNLIDIVSTGGVISLAAYLAIFAAVAYYLAAGYRRGAFALPELATATAIFTAYFIHNLAVFDAIANYVYLMAALAWVYWLSTRPLSQSAPKTKTQREEAPVAAVQVWRWNRAELAGLAVGLSAAAWLIFGYNVVFAKVFTNAVDASMSWNSRDISVVYQSWRQTLSYRTPLDRDIRALLASQISGNFNLILESRSADRGRLLDLAVSAARDNIKLAPQDALLNMWLSYALYYRGAINQSDSDMSEALKYAELAVAHGGQHIPLALYKSGLEFSNGLTDQSIQTLETALSWYDKYYDIYCNLADQKLIGRQEYSPASYEQLALCLDHSERRRILNPEYLGKAADYYRKQGDLSHAVAALELYYAKRPEPAVKQSLGQLYRQTGQLDKAERLMAE